MSNIRFGQQRMHTISFVSIFTISILMLMIAGCASLGPMPSSSQNEPAPVDQRTDSPNASRSSNAPITSSNATSNQMLLQARVDRVAGRLDVAESMIERALRIDPNNPLLWIELGEINLAAGNRAQARTMGSRALSLSGGNPSIENSARQLMR